jgi:DNA polymerase-3 subunit beta
MRFTCLKGNLNAGLAIAGRAVAGRTTLPITQNILLSATEGRLKLTATNLEIVISTWVGGQVDEEGELTLPARLLIDLVNTLPEGSVELVTTSQNRGLTVRSARFQSTIQGTDATEFPPIPTIKDAIVAQISSQGIKSAINQVAFAAATDDNRPVLTGVKIEIAEDTIIMAAADGFRLGVYYGKLLQAASDIIDVIIPAKYLMELARIIGDQDEVVEISVTPQKNQLQFKFSDVEMTTPMLSGTFPNYSQLIPVEYTTRLEVDLKELQQATKMASIFAKDGSNIVRFQFGSESGLPQGKLTISARTEEVGDNRGEIDATVEGDGAKMAFNSRYLMDVFSAISSPRVALEMTDHSSPGVIRPVGSDQSAHVIMPMFVQW